VKTLLLAIICTSVFSSLGKAQGNRETTVEPAPERAAPPQKPVQPGPEAAVPPEKPPKVVFRRLESVSWNPVTAELTWMLSIWDPTISTDQPAGQERYVIHLDKAVMQFQEETRSFDNDEAKHVRSIMDLISRYALESTVWWGRGGGTPNDHHWDSSPQDRDRTNPKDAPDGNGNQSKPELKGTPIVMRGR
jgi:hypothetical protein